MLLASFPRQEPGNETTVKKSTQGEQEKNFPAGREGGGGEGEGYEARNAASLVPKTGAWE